MGKNFCNLLIRQKATIQSLQRTKADLQEKINKPIQKWAKGINRHFPKEDKYVANKYMKKCSSSLLIREMQIKTTLRYHLIPVSMAIINKSEDKRCWRRYGEIGTFYIVGGSLNQFNHWGRQCHDPSRT